MAEILKHLVGHESLTPPFLQDELFPLIKTMEIVIRGRGQEPLVGRMCYLLFEDPSSVTRESFERAITLLGATFSKPEMPAVSHWQTDLRRQIRTINDSLFDCIILRSKTIGGAKIAASTSRIPVINAGEGMGGSNGIAEHPTQAAADAFVIAEKMALQGLRVAFVGDSRHNSVVNSLVMLLADFAANFTFVTPFPNNFPPALKEFLEARHNEPCFTPFLDRAIKDTQVLYFVHSNISDGLQLAKDRRIGGEYQLTPDLLNKLSPQILIMDDLLHGHRLDEFDDHRIVDGRQIQAGVFARMALLKMLLG